MTELLTAAEMRGIERDAIASGQVTGLDLMERAGQGVVDAILAHWPQHAQIPARAKVLCGPGNNGGDGFVIARLLADRGWSVTCYLLGDAEKLPADARTNHDRWVAAQRPVIPLTEQGFRADPGADIYVDAVFGTGLTRAPEGDLESLLRHLGGYGGDGAHYHPRLVAVDAPSGLCLDSGQLLGGGSPAKESSSVPLAALTVTFEAPKIGHFIGDGPAVCGKLVVVDLGLRTWRGIPRDATTGSVGQKGQPIVPRARLIDRVPLVDPPVFPSHPPPSFHKPSGHKYDHGHVLIVAGGQGRTGAARLAARAALRVGAGLVTLAAPPEAMAECAAQLTAVMLREVNGPTPLARLLEDPRFTTICLGPGLGPTQATRDLVKTALAAGRKTILDADALTAFEGHPLELFDAIAAITPMSGSPGAQRPDPRVVLTPHAGEFRRLFPDLAERWQSRTRAPAMTYAAYTPDRVTAAFRAIAERRAAERRPAPRFSKVDAVRAAAARSQAVVLLKGPDTVIGTPDGRIAINAAVHERAVPWLATAGSGDVLAGLIAGLAARRTVLAAAVADAAWLHVEAARNFGPGLIAEDLPEVLPRVFRDLGL